MLIKGSCMVNTIVVLDRTCPRYYNTGLSRNSIALPLTVWSITTL